MKCEICKIRKAEWYVWYLDKWICNECRLKQREKPSVWLY